MRFVVLLALVSVTSFGAACSRGGEPEPPSSPVPGEGTGEPVAELGEGSGSGRAAVDPASAQRLDGPPLPPERVVTPGVTSFPIGPDGGELVAGDARLSVPSGALREETVIEFEALAHPDALDRGLPPSLPLGALRGGPWNVPLERAAEISVALNYELAPNTQLELLAYHLAMRSWLVVGEGRADETGTRATFRVRQLGDMIVRAVPVQAEGSEERCDAPRMRFHDRWPGGAEADVVGLVPEEERITREDAFALLTDFRLSSAYELVEFKNEEVVDLPRTTRDERAHVDEDFLMDPNAAAAVEMLAQMVLDEWVDPISGRSAQMLRITESYDALIEHSHRSTHYQGRGIDLTVTPIPVASQQSRGYWYGRLAQLSICAGFDYVLFEDLYHVHASVLPTEFGIALAEGSGGVTGGAMVAWGEQQALQPVVWGVEGSGETSVVGETSDGMRRVVVRDGQAWLINTAGGPPPGSVHRDGSPIDLRYPYPLSDGTVDVERAQVRPHERTQEARSRHGLRR